MDSYGVWAGFGLVGWIGIGGSGGGVVGSGLFGCFCYGFAGFCFAIFFFFFFGFLVPLGFWWVEGSDGVVGMVVAWWALFIWLLRK